MPGSNAFLFDLHPEARRFPPSAEGALDALAVRYGLSLCDDYRRFVSARNGYDFGSVATTCGTPANLELLDFVRYLFGVGTGFPYNDLSTILPKVSAGLGSAYLGFCYPIGECRGGDLLVQVSTGTFRGRIMLIDHGRCMTAEAFEHAYQRSIADFPPDVLLPWLCRAEAFVALAPSLADFIDGLQEMRSDAGTTNVAIVLGGFVGARAAPDASR